MMKVIETLSKILDTLEVDQDKYKSLKVATDEMFKVQIVNLKL